MEITFKCKNCGQAGTIDEACAGLLMKCIRCLEVLTIPVPRGTVSATQFIEAEQEAPAEPQCVCPFCLESNPQGAARCHICGHALGVTPQARHRVKRLGLSFAVGSLAVALITGLVWFLTLTGQRPAKVTQARASTPQYVATPPLPVPTIVREPVRAPEPSKALEPVIPPPPEVKPAVTPLVISEAQRTVRQLQDLNAATKSKGALEYEQYAEKVGSLATVVDDLLRVVEEGGGFDSNVELREICKRASDAFFDHNLALNHWNVERSLKADKEAVRRAHQARMESAVRQPEVVQTINDTTEELDELTYRVMRAINDRFDLWIDAQQQEDALQVLIARLGK